MAKTEPKKDEVKNNLEEEGAEFSEFPEISQKTVTKLKERGINGLFPIQSWTFN
jgi:superfamily II DNA/RNA helicase